MSHEIGERVGAIMSANPQEVFFFGYGVYQGREIPDEQAGGLCPALREAGVTNPKILLDDGHVVWGAECWWGPEQKIKDTIGDRKVVMVDLSDRRVYT